MKKVLRYSLILCLLLGAKAYAQDRVVSGKVTAADDKLPIPGVTVKAVGASAATQTNADGLFTLSIPEGVTQLQFSFLGYATRTLPIAAGTMNVVLKQDSKQLQEVVVTGYQSLNKKEVTGSSSTINGKMVEQKPIISVTQLLQGTSTGLQVTGASGRPGANAFIRIRGVGSISAGSEPLFILDGLQIQASAYNALNPNDIEQITVLKDAAASAIYGSRAANGVIVITTKSGKMGEPVLSYSFRTGRSEAQELKNTKLMTPIQKLQYEYELAYQNPYLDSMIVNRIASGELPAGSTIFNVTPTQKQGLWDLLSSRSAGNWRDVLLQKALSNTHEIALSGATNEMKYYFSLNTSDNQGVEVLSGFNKKGGRLNVEYQAKDWFKIGTNIGVTATHETQVREPFNTQNLYASTFLYNPYEPVYNADGTYNTTMAGFSSLEGSTNNPAQNDRLSTFGTLFGEAKFFKHLTLKSQVGINYNTFKRQAYTKPGSNLAVLLGLNQKNDQGNQDFYYVFTNTANWNQTLGQKHNINALIGTEFNYDNIYFYSLTGRSFPTASVSTLDNAATPAVATTSVNEFALISYLTNISYNYDKRYYLSFSGRRDGSSRFGQNNRYATFSSFGFAWDIKNESFINAEWLSSLRLSASAGTTGNNNIGNYDAYGTYSLTPKYNDKSAAAPIRLPNPNLTWETKEKRNLGLSFGLFDERISGSVDYYNDLTKDLLYNVNVSLTTGFSSYKGNIGNMQNSGLEFSLNGDIIRNDNLRWSINTNYSTNNNKITKLYSDDVPTTYGRYKVGEPIETFFLVRWAGVNPANGKNTFYNIDGTTTETYSSSQAVLLKGKSPNVKFFGNVATNVRYKGFDLGANMYFSGGNYILNVMYQVGASDGENYNSNQFTDAFNYWKNPGDNVPFANPLDVSQNVTYDTDKYLEKGDYITLRDVTLGYTLSEKYCKYIKAKGLRVYLQGTNLFLGTKFRGLPEVGESNGERADYPGSFNLYGYPPIKAYTFGLDIKF